jgi:hypothetical protein
VRTAASRQHFRRLHWHCWVIAATLAWRSSCNRCWT